MVKFLTIITSSRLSPSALQFQAIDHPQKALFVSRAGHAQQCKKIWSEEAQNLQRTQEQAHDNQRCKIGHKGRQNG